MRRKLSHLAFLAVCLGWISSDDATLRAQSNNCACNGAYWGYLPFVLVEPVCVSGPYGTNLFAFTPQSCAAQCAALGQSNAQNTCGATCERDGYTYDVVSWSWSGSWNFYQPPYGNGFHNGSGAC